MKRFVPLQICHPPDPFVTLPNRSVWFFARGEIVGVCCMDVVAVQRIKRILFEKDTNANLYLLLQHSDILEDRDIEIR